MNEVEDRPRPPRLIGEEIRELDGASVSAREWLSEHPDDQVVSLLVSQYDGCKALLLAELQASRCPTPRP